MRKIIVLSFITLDGVMQAPEDNMGGFLRRNELNAFVSPSAHVNPLEQSLSSAQQDR